MAMQPEYQAPNIQIGKFGAILTLIGLVFILFVASLWISIVNIGGNEVGIVEKKFGGKKLPQGRIIAVAGENGIQAQTLEPGWHFFYWPWQYDITKVPVMEIKEGYVGVMQAADGQSLPEDTVYAPEWDNPDEMLSAVYFLTDGNGYKGPQLTVLKPGKYRLNTKLFTVKQAPITNVGVGTVAVVKSNVGDAPESDNRLVEVGQRGIWSKPLGEGQYYLHPLAYEVTPLSIRQVKVSYTQDTEQGEGRHQPMRPITVRSNDGNTFPVDVRVTYLIERDDAPLVVATVGDDDLVLSKLVTPAVRAIFRNNAEKVKALEYVQKRSEQEQQSFEMLQQELERYGVTVLAVRIGDVGDEESLGELLKTQTDREIALQQQMTFEEQQRAAEKEKALSRTLQEAEEEKRLATAAYSVQVAEQEKQQRIIDAEAEAEQVRIVAEAQAQAFRMVAEVIGENNAALIEIMKVIADKNIRITPDVMVGSGDDGGTQQALMGTILRKFGSEGASGGSAAKP